MTVGIGWPETLESWLGLSGSLALLFAPARDQFLRWKKWFHMPPTQRAKNEFWDVVGEGYEAKRNAWNFIDSLSIIAGAGLIGASFVVTTQADQTTGAGPAVTDATSDVSQ